MFKKLEELEKEYEQLNKLLADPKIIENQVKFQEYAKKHADISKKVIAYKEFKFVLKEIEGNMRILAEEKDLEFKNMVHDEINELESKKAEIEKKIEEMMFPVDPSDKKKYHCRN